MVTKRKPSITRIHWDSEELTAVIQQAAVLRDENPRLSYSLAVLNAQALCLPADRRRPDTALKATAKAAWGARIDAYMPNKRAEERAKRLVDKSKAVSAMTSTLPENHTPVSALPISLEAAINSVVESFGKSLRDKLSKEAVQAIEAVGKGLNTMQRTGEIAAPVSAINTSQGQSVSAIKREKVGYIGGGQKGSDIQIVQNDLQDIYKFVFVDNDNQRESLKDCGVIIRSKHCSHSIRNQAREMSPNAVWIEDQSPTKVNELLMQRFINNECSTQV